MRPNVARKLGLRAEGSGINSLSGPERTVLYIWWATGIIDNGGFQYFYEGASEAAEVAAAFDAVGLPGPAAACRKSLAAFPNGLPPSDRMERVAILDAYQGAQQKIFGPLDEVIWNASEHGLPDVLAEFIRSNATCSNEFCCTWRQRNYAD